MHFFPYHHKCIYLQQLFVCVSADGQLFGVVPDRPLFDHLLVISRRWAEKGLNTRFVEHPVCVYICAVSGLT